MSEFHRMPFVDYEHLTQGGHWALPRTGNYSGGTLAGEASARAFLKDLRQKPEFNGGHLQDIALDMAQSLAACRTDAERDAVRGQFVGFFATLEELLQPLTRQLRTLEAVTWEQLRCDVDVGLALADEADCDREFERRARREAARRGWLKRRRAA